MTYENDLKKECGSGGQYKINTGSTPVTHLKEDNLKKEIHPTEKEIENMKSVYEEGLNDGFKKGQEAERKDILEIIIKEINSWDYITEAIKQKMIFNIKQQIKEKK